MRKPKPLVFDDPVVIDGPQGRMLCSQLCIGTYGKREYKIHPTSGRTFEDENHQPIMPPESWRVLVVVVPLPRPRPYLRVVPGAHW